VQDRLGIAGVQLVDRAKAALRLFAAAALAQREPQVVERGQVSRSDLERPPVAFDRAGEIARGLAGVALLLELIGVARGQGA
jgi:hypothetical protein